MNYQELKDKFGFAGLVIGVILPLWGGMVFLYDYEKNLVKKPDLALTDLDARIERTEILVAVYSRDTERLTEPEKNAYERSKSRLIHLESQRDKLLGVE